MINTGNVTEWKFGGVDASMAILNGRIVWRKPMFSANPFKEMDGLYIQNIDPSNTTVVTINIPKNPYLGTNSITGVTSDGRTVSVNESTSSGVTYTLNGGLSNGQWLKITGINTRKCPNIVITGGNAMAYGNLSTVRGYKKVYDLYASTGSDSRNYHFTCGGRYQALFKNSTSLIYAHNIYMDRHAGKYAYYQMFSGCRNLVSSPLFRAVSSTYDNTFTYTFSGCQSLKDVWILSPDFDLTTIGTLPSTCTLHYNRSNQNVPSNVLLQPISVAYSTVSNPSPVTIIPTKSDPYGDGGAVYQNFVVENVLAFSSIHINHAGGNYYTSVLYNNENENFRIAVYDYATNTGGFDRMFPQVLLGQYRNTLRFWGGAQYPEAVGKEITLSFPNDIFDMNTGLESLNYAIG